MAVAPAAHSQAVEETTTGLDHRKLLIWTFLASECMFFGTLIATYMVYHGRSLEGPFPYEVFNIPYTSISAFVLLMSSLTMVLALAALRRGNMWGTRVWILATALLGMVFLGGQVFEFTIFFRAGVSLQGNLFGASFFALTGFHGAHVAIGVLILLTMFAMTLRGRLTPANSLNLELAGLYWHFVDVVWIIIFTVVYLFEAPNIV